MEDHPVQFLRKRTPECRRIIPNPVDTDIDFPADGLTRIRQREGDNIRIKVVLKELPVNFQQILVGTEDIVQLCEGFLFPPEKRDNKLLQACPLLQGNGLKNMKLYFGVNSWHFRKS